LKPINSNVFAGQVIALADLPNLTYVPATNENGIKTFTVTASDGSASSSPATTVSMIIAAVNDPPTLQTPAVITITDTSATDSFAVVNGNLVAADVDANTTLTYSIAGITAVDGIATRVGTYATLVLMTSTGAYTYTPNNAAINALTSNIFGSIWFGVSDGTVTTTANLVVNLVAANDTPTLITPAAITITDTSATDSFAVVNGSLLAADVDANTTLTYSIAGGTVVGTVSTKVGTYGTLVLTTATGVYTYTPNNAAINALTANNSESFTFGVSDNIVTTTANLVVNLVAANDTPIVLDIAPVVYTNTNAADVFANASGTISASDADANAVLTYGISGQGVVISNGSATLAGQFGTLRIVTANGEYSYLPNQNQLDHLSGNAVDNFTFTISDGIATVKNSFVVKINDREAPSVAISSNGTSLKAGELANVNFTCKPYLYLYGSTCWVYFKFT